MPAEDIDDWRVEVFAGSPNADGVMQGPAHEAGMPGGSLCFLPSGEAFIAGNGLVVSLTANRTARLFAGTPGVTGYQDGPATEALLGRQLSLSPDNRGGLYLGDRSNRCVRRLRKRGDVWIVETVAGNPAQEPWTGTPTDGIGANALFRFMHSNVAADPAGFAYVMDGNFLRRIAPDGAVETLNPEGGAGKPGDGPLGQARFNLIMGAAIAMGEAHTIYVADRWNFCLREIDLASGTVSTLAGPNRGYKDGEASDVGFHGGPTYIVYDPFRKRVYATGADDWGLRAFDLGTRDMRTIAGGNRRGAGLANTARAAAIHYTGVRAVDPRPPHDIYFTSGKEWRGLIGRLYRPTDEQPAQEERP